MEILYYFNLSIAGTIFFIGLNCLRCKHFSSGKKGKFCSIDAE